MPLTATPMISVVVASVESASTLRATLDSVVRSCPGERTEVLVVDASSDGSADLAEAWGPQAQVFRREVGTLVPELWGEGIRRSRGGVVALTTGHCVVPLDWASALMGALEAGAGGVGAGLLPLASVRPTDLAVFYLRYAAFLDLTEGGQRAVAELPGDNAAYGGPALRAYLGAHPEGFWELDYHRELGRAGRPLIAVPRATVGFGRSFPLRVIARHRFEHGRHHGEWRVRRGGQALWRVLLPAPLVPLVLFIRTARRTLPRAGHRVRFVRAAVPFLLLAVAWALGEAAGAWSARHDPRADSP